jgi:phosphoglycolate phosphatase-like HAD superfamily hydrolase
MLLNYNKPVSVSSAMDAFPANFAVDESIRTYWSALSGNAGEWLATDLGKISAVRAVQINYADQDAELMGKQKNIYHAYRLLYSEDGKKWNILADKSRNTTDVPHDYVELEKPVSARYLKLENVHVPTGKFAISGFRVFGSGNGARPAKPENLIVLRTERDKRSAWLKWKPSPDAYAYNIYMGTSADKLYNCVMVYGANEYWLKSLDRMVPYYFRIEAINENGTSELTDAVYSE